MHSVENIIVRMPNWVGDLVMATPILTDLRRAYPKARITAMCKRPICELLEKDEAIDELFCFTRPSNDFARRKSHRDIVQKIASGHYDLGILLTHSFSSAWWFWQAGIPRRVGFRGHFRRLLLTQAPPFPEEKIHQVEVYKTLLKALGLSSSDTVPRLFLEKKEILEAKELLYQRGYKEGIPLIGINPGAAYGSAKCWPPERFRALAEALLAQKDLYVVFFSDPTGASLVKEICLNLPPRVMNLGGVTSLRELCCLIQECSVLVSNDSGPMHIGAALQVPLVALFGSTDEHLTGPYGQQESVIHKNVSCSPCFQRKCPIDFACMNQIEVQEVLQKVLRYV